MTSLTTRSSLLLLGILLAGSIGGGAAAQSSWDRYRPGLIASIIQQHDSSVHASWNGRGPSWVLTGDQFPTRTVVTYLGDSRTVDSTRREIVRRWGLSFMRDSSLATGFSREYLFQEGQQRLWLPVSDSVATFIPNELEPGQRILLFVLWLGAQYAGKDVTWAFIATDFLADTTQR